MEKERKRGDAVIAAKEEAMRKEERNRKVKELHEAGRRHLLLEYSFFFFLSHYYDF
jgi:hypothetical protein